MSNQNCTTVDIIIILCHTNLQMLTKKLVNPDNFEELLPTLKKNTFQWESMYYSGTKINTSGKIALYQTQDTKPCGNIILIPGLATNTSIDPLMKSITYWSLTHRYNVITFDTFLGDFHESPCLKTAQQNTFPEFIALIQAGIHFIEPYTINSYSCVIGHSAGATGLIAALNNITKQNKPIKLSAVMLFAPWASKEFPNYLENMVYTRLVSNGFKGELKYLPISNCFDTYATHKTRYVTILPNFLHQLATSPFHPDLMNKWNLFITIVAAGKDKKAPADPIHQRYTELQQYSNKSLFKYVEVKDAKHSFLNIGTTAQNVISLIKAQRNKIQK